jgi:hypothetical protein
LFDVLKTKLAEILAQLRDVSFLNVFLSYFRLAYHQRMVDIVPDNFGAFVPDKPEPACKYEGEPSPGTKFMHSRKQIVLVPFN